MLRESIMCERRALVRMREHNVQHERRESMIEHEVYALNAQCYICQEPAAFSKRLVSNDEVFLVGGDDVYQPVCKKHFYE